MVVTLLGQRYNVGEKKPTVILYTIFIAMQGHQTKTKQKQRVCVCVT